MLHDGAQSRNQPRADDFQRRDLVDELDQPRQAKNAQRLGRWVHPRNAEHLDDKVEQVPHPGVPVSKIFPLVDSKNGRMDG